MGMFLVLLLSLMTRPGSCRDLMDKILSSKTWQIKTCGPPRIDDAVMSNMTVKPGQKVVFNCKVDLSCMVSTIKWYHEMINGTEVMIGTPSDPGIPYVHEIRSVAPSDTGMYTCVARNVVGRAHAAAYLQVDDAPQKYLHLPLLLFCLLLPLNLLSGVSPVSQMRRKNRI